MPGLSARPPQQHLVDPSGAKHPRGCLDSAQHPAILARLQVFCRGRPRVSAVPTRGLLGMPAPSTNITTPDNMAPRRRKGSATQALLTAVLALFVTVFYLASTRSPAPATQHGGVPRSRRGSTLVHWLTGRNREPAKVCVISARYR